MAIAEVSQAKAHTVEIQNPIRNGHAPSEQARYLKQQIKDLGQRIRKEFRTLRERSLRDPAAEGQATEPQTEHAIELELGSLSETGARLLEPNHDTAPIVIEPAASTITELKGDPVVEKKPSLYAPFTQDQLEQIWQEGRESRMRELEKKIGESPAVEYPDHEVLPGPPTKEQISDSVDRYIGWRREHENNEGVREPGRANVLAHATSVDGATGILAEGQLRSILNLLCSDNPRIDLMQGGKAKYIAAATKTALTDPALQQTVVEGRMKLTEYMPWLNEQTRSGITKDLHDASTVAEVLKVAQQSIDIGYQANFWPRMSRTGVFERHPPWNLITNLLPKETRKEISRSANPEPYISTTLGHALEIYTPAAHDPSRQAAIVSLDAQNIPLQNIHMGGGTNNYHAVTGFEWDFATKEAGGLPARIFTHEASYGGDATEINIEDGSPDGTAITIGPHVAVLLPASQEMSVRQMISSQPETAARLDRVVWFDDSKFRSVDEALGWMVTTPEGKALMNAPVPA